MLRLAVIQRGRLAAFRASDKRLLWWSSKESELHRVARQRPWWENTAIFIVLLCFIQGSSMCYYLCNRWYQAFRPSGNSLYINNMLDEKVFTRPDLSVALVRMVVHHALSGAQTPFAIPMVYPEYLRPEAEELMSFVIALHKEQPMFSIPDLWALLSSKALSRLGGPSVQVRRGRPDPPPDLSEEQLLVSVPSLVEETQRDVLKIKRLLAGKGFSVDEIVAMVGGIRNIGFHESSGFHTRAEVRPVMRRRFGALGPENDVLRLPESQYKCTLDPYVFGGEYFDLLLDYHWTQRGLFRRPGDLFQCDEGNRKREIVMLDPFSEQALERERKRLVAKERAREAVVRAAEKKELHAVPVDGSTTGRHGEAQYIGGSNDKAVTGGTVQTVEPLVEMPEFKSPCSSVSMREIDMTLLDDALLLGWVHRFSANEINFYTVFGKTIEKIHCHGYNVNSLYLPT
ncbi:hypothetical protein TRVL_04913 [Trypanosoma vivax]|nr:hypothetical protein TRVL_04913 [Trypanosoma vivax]